MLTLEKSIFFTLSYFDIFGIPLTLSQIRVFLFEKKAGSEEIKCAIEPMLKRGLVEREQDFYFLAGRHGIIKERILKEKISEKLISKTVKLLPILKMAPFVRAILITGSTSMKNATDKSDIDLILITERDFIYTAKTFLWVILKILGQYETKTKKKGQFSIGYCYSTSYLTLLENAFKYPWPMRRYWLCLNMPVFDIGGYQKLLGENDWMEKELPNFSLEARQEMLKNLNVDTRQSLAQKIIERGLDNKLGKFLESILAKLHIEHTWRLPENYLSSSGTVASRNRLQLNAKEASKHIKQEFEERIKLYT